MGGIGDDALHADQPLARMGRVGPVDGRVGKGDDLAVVDFADGEGNVIAPAREVDEDAPLAADRDAGRHGAVEFEDGLDRSDPMLRMAAGRPSRQTQP